MSILTETVLPRDCFAQSCERRGLHPRLPTPNPQASGQPRAFRSASQRLRGGIPLVTRSAARRGVLSPQEEESLDGELQRPSQMARATLTGPPSAALHSAALSMPPARARSKGARRQTNHLFGRDRTTGSGSRKSSNLKPAPAPAPPQALTVSSPSADFSSYDAARSTSCIW